MRGKFRAIARRQSAAASRSRGIDATGLLASSRCDIMAPARPTPDETIAAPPTMPRAINAAAAAGAAHVL
ncbi:MAG TPA: hypothetical protein VE964_04060, partial [Myxococcales bacterium]|nr:hypothetical protein [Myxococcales bacterium]